MLWAVESRGLSKHLTKTTITQAYKDMGKVGSVTPEMQWRLDQAAVKQLIATSIPDSVFNSIKTGTSAKDVWDVLKKLYEGRTMLILVDLGRWLQMTWCAEEDSIWEHFEGLKDLCEQLAAMGKSVSNTKFASILMGSLPPLYQPTLSGIAAAAEMSAMIPTVATVTKLAIDEYDRRTLVSNKSQDQAFATDARKKGKKHDVECFNCKKKGHVRADCWAKGRGKEGQGPKRKKHGSLKEGGMKNDAAAGAKQAGDQEPDIEAWAAIEETEEGEQETPQVPTMVANEAGGTEAELYDSGASHHMCPICERFVTYHEIPARPITAANNRVFYAIGIGDLDVQVPNGVSLTKV